MPERNIMESKRWVLIRGLSRSRFHWLGFETLLKQSLNLETIDCPEIPGNGYLHNTETPSSLDAVVDHLRQQISLIKKPVGLFGISLGGMIATRWAQMYPEEVERLVLVNTSSSLSPFYHRFSIVKYLGTLKSIFVKNLEKSESFIMSSTSNCPLKWKPKLAELVKFQKEHPIATRNFIRQLRLASKVDFTQKPHKNVLILTSAQDHLVNWHCSRRIAEQWQVPLLINPTAGHDLTLDDPQWIIEQISE